MVNEMKAKLITLFAAALIVVGAVAVAAVASPDTKGSNDSSNKQDKQLKDRDKSRDKVRGTVDGSKSDRRQDARLGHESSWDDAGYNDARDDSNDGNSVAAFTSFDGSNDKAEKHDKDSRHKEGTRADRRADRRQHVEEVIS